MGEGNTNSTVVSDSNSLLLHFHFNGKNLDEFIFIKYDNIHFNN